MAVRTNSQRYRILEFVREHPEGIRRREIADMFPVMRLNSIDSILAALRNENLIFNDGIMGVKGSTWFPVTNADVASPFPDIAADLMAELREIHYAGQELHLARRLEELFGSKPST